MLMYLLERQQEGYHLHKRVSLKNKLTDIQFEYEVAKYHCEEAKRKYQQKYMFNTLMNLFKQFMMAYDKNNRMNE
jgi:hypothetical protein